MTGQCDLKHGDIPSSLRQRHSRLRTQDYRDRVRQYQARHGGCQVLIEAIERHDEREGEIRSMLRDIIATARNAS
jgi:hypothetical protein